MSTKGIDGFVMDLRDFANRIMPEAHAKFCRVIAMEMLSGVVKKNPVKTGLSRGNWQVAPSSPVSSPTSNLDKDGNMTIMNGLGKIMSNDPMKSVLYITNLIYYISLLEDGHSSQAPNGMVELTLREVEAKAKANVI